MGPIGNGGTWVIGHRGYGVQGLWATLAMGHMGNGVHGQWGTGVWANGQWGPWAICTQNIKKMSSCQKDVKCQIVKHLDYGVGSQKK